MITHYDLTEYEVNNKAFEQSAIYFCRDTGNIYIDSESDNTRHKVSGDIIMLSTESNRTSILAPVPYKIYCVVESGCMYVYTTEWHRVGGSQFVIDHVEVTDSTTIQDARITSFDEAQFIPDLSIEDLVKSSSCVCSDGKVEITVISDYPVFGSVIVR